MSCDQPKKNFLRQYWVDSDQTVLVLSRTVVCAAVEKQYYIYRYCYTALAGVMILRDLENMSIFGQTSKILKLGI